METEKKTPISEKETINESADEAEKESSESVENVPYGNPEEKTTDEAVTEETESGNSNMEAVKKDEDSDAVDENQVSDEGDSKNNKLLQVTLNLQKQLQESVDLQKQFSEQINDLTKLFQNRILHSEHEEKIIDQMHQEIQKYRDDLYAQLLQPVLKDIIEVRDSIMRISATYQSKPDGEQSIPHHTFSGYAYDLQDILERNAVELYQSMPGESFIPLRHRVIKKVPTSDESLHGKIAETLSCGYRYGERVLSPEKISVYMYEPNNNDKDNEVKKNG